MAGAAAAKVSDAASVAPGSISALTAIVAGGADPVTG
jgi:hypothetical protein